MELSPADLGSERYLSIMRRRLTAYQLRNGWGTYALANAANMDEPLSTKGLPSKQRRGRRLRKFWSHGLNLDEQTAGEVADLAWRGSSATRAASLILISYFMFMIIIAVGASGAGFVPVFLLSLFWALIVAGIVAAPRAMLRDRHKRVLTKAEVETLLPNARGRLERTYLNLVLDTMRQNIPSESAKSDIRSALRDLGETISRLPGDAIPVSAPAQLLIEAQARREEAQFEQDSFVQSSLLRQADTLERRAKLAGENAVSARRLASLRREARTQMDALRSVLVAFERTSHADSAEIAHLSETVQHVASEAQAVSIARRELEEDEVVALFGKPIPQHSPVQPSIPSRKLVPLPARIGGTQTAADPAEEAPKPGQNKIWWRGQ